MLATAFRRSFLAALSTGMAVFPAIEIKAASADEPSSTSSPSAQIDPRLKALVGRHLRSKPDHRSGDLLSRGDVEPIFNELLELGWQPATGSEGLYSPFLRNDAYLVQLFQSPQGRAFMRKVNRLPEAYDRLERLSWSVAGRPWLRELVEAENGAKLFAELLTEDGEKLIAATLKDDPVSRNFRLPTGHVYTDVQLLELLQQLLTSQRSSTSASAKDGDR